ncbi:MAG: hypothetical protein RBU37_15250 [Myxococcota bacterium]|jgi:hypothetical protein|nr:hypothetical protein [Myxococcota bacterium]
MISIRRFAGSLEWEWDGMLLRPWTGPVSQGWEFDGNVLRPWGGGIDTWDFDGRTLRPRFRTDLRNWEWDGHALSPWGGGLHEGIEIVGKEMWPYTKGLGEGWVADGELPVPIWAVVAGLVRHRDA